MEKKHGQRHINKLKNAQLIQEVREPFDKSKSCLPFFWNNSTLGCLKNAFIAIKNDYEDGRIFVFFTIVG